MHKTETERMAFTVNEAANMVGLGQTKMREIINANQIRIVRVGRRILVPRKAIEAYLEAEAQ